MQISVCVCFTTAANTSEYPCKQINAKAGEFDFTYINYPKLSGACLVLSSDLIKFGVNIPSCMIYNDDHGLSIMAQKLLGENYIQFVCKNLLHVHARRHPQKRLYVKDESNPNSFEDKKTDGPAKASGVPHLP